MTEKPKTVDFGAQDKFGAHVFRIEIPAARKEPVVIVEDYGYRGQEAGVPRDEERVVLKRSVWSAIADIDCYDPPSLDYVLYCREHRRVEI